MSDELAQQLANLEVQRSRTLADLESVEAADASLHKAELADIDAQSAINARYVEQLTNDDLGEHERQRLYKEWGVALEDASNEFNALKSEHERFHVQQLILVRMLTELDARIKTLREKLTS